MKNMSEDYEDSVSEYDESEAGISDEEDSDIVVDNTVTSIKEEVSPSVEDNADLKARSEWLRSLSHDHTELGNRLINIARRMKVIASCSNDQARAKMDTTFNLKTFELTESNHPLPPLREVKVFFAKCSTILLKVTD